MTVLLPPEILESIQSARSREKKRCWTEFSTRTDQTVFDKTSPDIIIKQLERCTDWHEIYDDPLLRSLAPFSYENLRRIYGDLKYTRTTLGERFPSYLHQQGKPVEYEVEELLFLEESETNKKKRDF